MAFFRSRNSWRSIVGNSSSQSIDVPIYAQEITGLLSKTASRPETLHVKRLQAGFNLCSDVSRNPLSPHVFVLLQKFHSCVLTTGLVVAHVNQHAVHDIAGVDTLFQKIKSRTALLLELIRNYGIHYRFGPGGWLGIGTFLLGLDYAAIPVFATGERYAEIKLNHVVLADHCGW